MITFIKYRIMAGKNIPMDILSIVIYTWITCLMILISKPIYNILNFIIDFTYIFESLRSYTFGYNSTVIVWAYYLGGYFPFMYWFHIMYDCIITSTFGIIVWWTLFSYISVGIIVLFLIWVALKDIPILGLIVSGQPFKTLKGVFEILLEKIPKERLSKFKDFMEKYVSFLVSVLKIEKSEPVKIENFGTREIKEIPLIDNEYKEELEDEYKSKIRNKYYINAFKYNKHSEMAKIYRTMKIFTPDNQGTNTGFETLSISTETEMNKLKIK